MVINQKKEPRALISNNYEKIATQEKLCFSVPRKLKIFAESKRSNSRPELLINKNRYLNSKRSVSTVVATVLLVLITFMAVGIIWLFIRPMVEKNLEEGGTCFELRDQAEIVQGDYTYYNSSETSIVVKRGFEDAEIKGFKVSIDFGTESIPYSLINGEDSLGEITMSDGSSIIEIPVPGGAKTYIIKKGNGVQVDLGIITKAEDICDMGSYNIPQQTI